MSTSTLHERALAVLESPLSYPGLPEHWFPRVLLRVWRYPSFQPYASWALIATRKEETFVRRITWHPYHPLNETPVTFGAEAAIEASAREPLLRALRAIRLPPFIPADRAGIDGTTCGVEFGNDMRSARLGWWETPPAEWADLARWHADAIAAFEALLPAHTPAASGC